MTDKPLTGFMVKSIYGLNTDQPLVDVQPPDGPAVQMRPYEARDLALNLLQAADAAESDAYLIALLRDKLGQPMETIATVLIDFRAFRQAAEQAARDD